MWLFNTEAKHICGGRETNIWFIFSASTQRENSKTNLLGYLVDPVGGTVAEIGALGVPGPTGKHA